MEQQIDIFLSLSPPSLSNRYIFKKGNEDWRDVANKLQSPRTLGRNAKWQECIMFSMPLWKTLLWSLKKLKTELPYDPAIHFWVCIYSKYWKQGFKEVFADPCSQQHYSQQPRDGGDINVINRWMDKENVVYMDNRISFHLKKEGSSGTCHNVNEPWGHSASEINQPHKDKCCLILLLRGAWSSQSQSQTVGCWFPGTSGKGLV